MTIQQAYQALGLDPTNSTPAQIRSAYRRAVLSNHPDTVQGTDRERVAHEATVQLNLAYEELEAAGFPCFTPAEEPSLRGTEHTSPSAAWTRQFDSGDAEFEAWRRAWVRDFGTVFMHDVRHMGPVRATVAWGFHLFQAGVGALFGVAGIALLINGQAIVGLIMALLGFGGAVVILAKLNGHRD